MKWIVLKRIVLTLALVRLASLVIGMVMIGSGLHPYIIRSSGTIAYLDGDSDSEEADSSIHVDERGYIPTFAGLGLLSVAFLLWKKKK